MSLIQLGLSFRHFRVVSSLVTEIERHIYYYLCRRTLLTDSHLITNHRLPAALKIRIEIISVVSSFHVERFLLVSQSLRIGVIQESDTLIMKLGSLGNVRWFTVVQIATAVYNATSVILLFSFLKAVIKDADE